MAGNKGGEHLFSVLHHILKETVHFKENGLGFPLLLSQQTPSSFCQLCWASWLLFCYRLPITSNVWILTTL